MNTNGLRGTLAALANPANCNAAIHGLAHARTTTELGTDRSHSSRHAAYAAGPNARNVSHDRAASPSATPTSTANARNAATTSARRSGVDPVTAPARRRANAGSRPASRSAAVHDPNRNDTVEPDGPGGS
ncbi:hypothetical protein PAI11_07760 [Patulibacter medicamentivorans]|uniref:Uncharacterized protein n=1 Tax=Patulibacter medicamentivorans TaxID=1097667 RepID=H0E1W4_9ACTN|nr:hypothetical protein PAI11_07760 [Patulibacter medicamentivorans]